MRFILTERESKTTLYHLAAWIIPAFTTITGLSLLYYPDAKYLIIILSGLDIWFCRHSSCHTSTSLSTAIFRILPNYFATYIPIAVVMLANPCLYRHSTNDMEKIIMSTSGQFTTRERDILDAIKIKFSVINIVFYICWLPNLLNGILLWTLWFHLPDRWIITIWYVMVNIYINRYA